MADAAGEMVGCFVRWAVLKCVVYAPYHRKYFRAVDKVNVSPLLRIREDLVSAICNDGTRGDKTLVARKVEALFSACRSTVIMETQP